jgi:hypothetical protein
MAVPLLQSLKRCNLCLKEVQLASHRGEASVKTKDAIGFVRQVISDDLVDLGNLAGAAVAGVLTPRAELGKAKIGITDQFLRDAKTYHEPPSGDRAPADIAAFSGTMGCPSA